MGGTDESHSGSIPSLSWFPLVFAVDGGVKTEEKRRFKNIVVPANEKTATEKWRLVFGISALSVFRLVLVFHPITWAFDQDGFCMMEESIQHG